jgi:chemotaxis protein histidine kinase CheA
MKLCTKNCAHWKQFFCKTTGKCEEIVSTLENLAASPDDNGLQHDLHRYLHTMAGSAGTFSSRRWGVRRACMKAGSNPG